MKGSKAGAKKYSDKINLLMLFRSHSFAKEMSLRQDDTFVIGYPKSGGNYFIRFFF
jgi:hypothetical protein